MHQSKAIHDALKQALRARGRTYAEATKILQLSEASVKRLFSTSGLSLKRLEALCDWLGLEIAELIDMSQRNRPQLTELEPSQEAELLASPRLLLLAFLLLNRWQEDEIVEYFDFSAAQLTMHLARLEELGLIERLPFGRVRLRTARNFAWRTDGPIQRFFAEQVLPEFLNTRFDGRGEHRQFAGGTLSAASVERIHEHIDRLARLFDELVEQDLKLPLEHRHGVSLLAAVRPWEFSGFSRLRKKPGNPYPGAGT